MNNSYEIEKYNEIISKYKDNKNVVIDKNFDYDVSHTRRPIYMVRGRNITREQVIEILSNEAPLFGGWGNGDSQIPNSRYSRSILGGCMYRRADDWIQTFMFSDGAIGANDLPVEKYPSPNEILPMWIEFGLKYDFLDMAVGYTDQNEGMCFLCKNNTLNTRCGGDDYNNKVLCDLVEDCNKLKDLLLKYWGSDEGFHNPTYEYLFADGFDSRWSHVNLVNRVKQTIVISGGKVHVLFGDNAMEAFKRYYDKYNDDNLVAMYDGRVFGYSGWHIFGQDFIKECFRYKGLPDKCYDIAVDKGLIIPIPDDAKVVTADFIREEHMKMIEKYGLNGIII